MIPSNLVNWKYMPSHKILQYPVDADLSFWCNSVSRWHGWTASLDGRDPSTRSTEPIFSLSKWPLAENWDNFDWQVCWLPVSANFELIFGAQTLQMFFLASICEGLTHVTLWFGGTYAGPASTRYPSQIFSQKEKNRKKSIEHYFLQLFFGHSCRWAILQLAVF